MLWKIVENALASAMSRAMLEARLDSLLGRVRAIGALSEEEIERLAGEVRERLEEVEREGREYRQLLDRTVRGFVERLFSGSDGPRSGGGRK